MKLTEENVPTNPSKWSYYKSQAKKKFDVYPSAYANAWAAKQYKAAGGGWRTKKSEATAAEEDEFHTKLDKLVHKTFGKSSDEKNESVNETITKVEMGDMGYVEKHKSIATVYGVMSGGKKVKVKLGKTGKVVVIDAKDIQILPESVNEASAQLNKKVKSYLDDYLRGEKKNSPEHQEVIMLIMRGALTDANFHSEARQLSKYFPKAGKKYIGTPMEDVIEDKGIQISKWAKWDGYDIIDAFAFYTSMTIGGSFGAKFQSLKESINEAYIVTYAKKKGEKTASAAFQLRGSALSFERDLKKDGYITMITQKKVKGIDESVNEYIEPQTKKIAYYTGTRPEAVKDFVSKHGLNITKLLKFVEKGKLPERMAVVSALAGRPGNPVQKKIIKQFSESINEDYYKSASDAADAARKYAEKKGFEIDEDDWQTQIAMGGKHNRLRPGVGKTHSFSVGLTKNGKPQRKALNISLYGMDSGKFELTTYIN